VANAQHVKKVPGRKTDVKDAEWIADLLCHGLLRPSFVPPKSRGQIYRNGRAQGSDCDRRHVTGLCDGVELCLAVVV